MRNKRRHLLLDIFVVLRIIITYIPFINFYCPEIIKIVTIVGLYLVLLFADKQLLSNAARLLPVFIIDVFSFTLLYLYPVEKSNFLLSIYALARPLSWALVGNYAISKERRESVHKWLLCFVICHVITAITTIIGCSIYPNAARLMANGMNDDMATYTLFMNMNIGGFSFVNTLVIFTPMIVYLFRERCVNRLFTAALLVLILITILTTEYTIALLFFIACLFIFLLPRQFSIKKFALYVIVAVGIFYIFRFFVSEIFQYFANNLESEQISTRFHEIADALIGVSNSEQTDLEDRTNRWLASWEDFLRHPLVGTGLGGGGHSFLLDNLAKYGIWGLIAEVILFSKIYKLFVKGHSNNLISNYFFISFLFQIGLALLNPIFFYEPFTLIMPLFLKTYETK